jgi:teichuronic acid exporter
VPCACRRNSGQREPRRSLRWRFAVLSNLKQLLLGNGLAQGLQLLSLLVLSRIYRPGDFGFLAQVQSIATLACIFATLQLHLTIPLSGALDKARAAAETVQSICLTIFVLSLPVAIYLGEMFTFSIVLALFLGLTNTYSSYLVFDGSFGRLSSFFITRALLVIGLQIGSALLAVPNGLIWGLVLAEGLAALYLRLAYLGPLHTIRIQGRDAVEMALKLKSFSLYGTIQEAMSVCAFYAPLLLFTSKFGSATGGHYAMASRLVWAPIVLLSGSLAQVLYHRFGKSPPTSVTSMCEDIFGLRAIGGILLACAVAFGLQDIFLWVLGPQWGLASRLFPLHLLWGAVFLLSTPFRVACRVLRLQKYQLAIDSMMLGAIWLVFNLSNIGPLAAMWVLVLIAAAQNALLATVVWGALSRGIAQIRS